MTQWKNQKEKCNVFADQVYKSNFMKPTKSNALHTL